MGMVTEQQRSIDSGTVRVILLSCALDGRQPFSMPSKVSNSVKATQLRPSPTKKLIASESAFLLENFYYFSLLLILHACKIGCSIDRAHRKPAANVIARNSLHARERNSIREESCDTVHRRVCTNAAGSTRLP